MELRILTVVVMTIMTMSTFLALVHETEGRPSRSSSGLDGWPEYRTHFPVGEHHRRAVNDCDNLSEVRELCQRCAKATKSKWAYPLCCEQRENTRTFCRNFVYFGVSPNDIDS